MANVIDERQSQKLRQIFKMLQQAALLSIKPNEKYSSIGIDKQSVNLMFV